MTAPWRPLVPVAHADAWQEQGQLREPFGGGVLELPGIRLMASGLPHPQWNNADVTDADLVDIDAVRAWYSARQTPWGVRVPRGIRWPHGEPLFGQRLMGLPRNGFSPAPAVPGLRLRLAGPADLDTVVGVDAAAFGGDGGTERPWIAPMLEARRIAVALAELDGAAVGTGYVVRSDGRAGPAAFLAGVGVAPGARRRGIGAAVSSWLLEHAFVAGAVLAHLNPDTDEAARVYARLGFEEVDGLVVHAAPAWQ
ncbi:GNAT family N-acetyltransferase [Herbiconiux sp. SYSU D00978]|uniref:GNAT family N-acetyltransferase n=1 Tax=Herbiconiux sp. SYSU D00978 TaxID=2812562 RepID=UPI001A95B44E|nr:GNAT family N-acetyltransferase [Herbiconiux sp. SYSU D00978]